MLVKMRGDVKDVSDRLDHATTLLTTLTGDVHEQDEELHLPNDVQLPLQSVGDMDVLEEALKDAQFRRRLVCKINKFLLTPAKVIVSLLFTIIVVLLFNIYSTENI
jgi:hypothetical protein